MAELTVGNVIRIKSIVDHLTLSSTGEPFDVLRIIITTDTGDETTVKLFVEPRAEGVAAAICEATRNMGAD